MRKLLIALAGVMTFAAFATSAGALSPGSIGGGLKNATEPGVVLVHRGSRACHRVRGVWYRDSRPNRRCWAKHRYWRHGLAWYRR